MYDFAGMVPVFKNTGHIGYKHVVEALFLNHRRCPKRITGVWTEIDVAGILVFPVDSISGNGYAYARTMAPTYTCSIGTVGSAAIGMTPPA